MEHGERILRLERQRDIAIASIYAPVEAQHGDAARWQDLRQMAKEELVARRLARGVKRDQPPSNWPCRHGQGRGECDTVTGDLRLMLVHALLHSLLFESETPVAIQKCTKKASRI
jgi:hypothetical protein